MEDVMKRINLVVAFTLLAAVGCTKSDGSCGDEYALADDGNCYPTAQVNLDNDADADADADDTGSVGPGDPSSGDTGL